MSFWKKLFNGGSKNIKATVRQRSIMTPEAVKPSAPASKYCRFHGLDLTPDVARKLVFGRACEQVAGLQMLSDEGDYVKAAKGNDYSVILHFKKTGGWFGAEINASTTSGFLGMGTPQPQQVWSQLGYRLQEDLREKATWTNGDAKIVAFYQHPGRLIEIHYVVPEKASSATADAATWRTLGFFDGGRGCVESSKLVSGRCYSNQEDVNTIIRYTKEEWKGSVPQGFWLVKAEAKDTSSDCPYCLGCDSQHAGIWQVILAAMQEAGCAPQGEGKAFRLTPNDLFSQTLIDTIHVRGILKG